MFKPLDADTNTPRYSHMLSQFKLVHANTFLSAWQHLLQFNAYVQPNIGLHFLVPHIPFADQTY